MSLGETIYRFRTEKNMSQSELADALEVSRQSISKWETDSSVPELDKLIKLSNIFGVSLDTLILGKENEDAAEQNEPVALHPTQTEHHALVMHKITGVVLLCFGFLIWLLLTLMGGFWGGLLFSVPFFLCAIICLTVHKNVGFWCIWAVFFAVDIYFRFATGITWRLTLWTLNYEPSMNYMRLAIAWIELLCFGAMFITTVLRFGKKQVEVTRKNIGLLIAGWVVFAGLHIPLPAVRVLYIFSDWVRLLLLTVQVTFTVRLIRSKQRKELSKAEFTSDVK